MKQEKIKPHIFCETPEEKCTMNYCDDNGCMNRKIELVEQDKKLYSDLVDLLERLRPIYKEDSVSHFKCEKQRINIIEQFKNK